MTKFVLFKALMNKIYSGSFVIEVFVIIERIELSLFSVECW